MDFKTGSPRFRIPSRGRGEPGSFVRKVATARVNSRRSREVTPTAPLLLKIKVKPNARTSSLEQAPDGTWIARVKAPPVDGRANDELVDLVARRFRCRRSAVVIRSGASGRPKILAIETS